MDADLAVSHDAEPVLESNQRSGVDAEQIPGQIAEIPLAERACEPVCHPERALEPCQPQRGRQTDECEVWFRQLEHGVVLILLRERGRCHGQGENERRQQSSR